MELKTEFNCIDFDNSNCPKGITSEKITNIKSEEAVFIFTGCWGVYCKTGRNKRFKLKVPNKEEGKKKDKEKGEKKEKDKEDGEKKENKYEIYGGKDVAQMMIEYSNKYNISAVILGGDNIYSDYPSEELLKYIDKIVKNGNLEEIKKLKKEVKNILYNMDKQFVEGFEKCIRQVKAKDFLVGIGNHDIETCDILNKQLNYPNWTMLGLYYNYVYSLNDGKNINFVFIDTNIYEDGKMCSGEPYPKNARSMQFKWLSNVLKENRSSWNIVIGHVPFIANSHKEGKPTRFSENLFRDLSMLSELIDLYLCADEHNQQYITYPSLPVEVISGSGGTVLDKNIQVSEDLIDSTKYRQANLFGFTALHISSENITIKFINKESENNKFEIYPLLSRIM